MNGKYVLGLQLAIFFGAVILDPLQAQPITTAMEAQRKANPVDSSVGVRPTFPKTVLTWEGVSTAVIVHPEGQHYIDLAKRLQDAVRTATGAALPLVSDIEATEKDAPILKKQFQMTNLILLGRLGNNRAIWPFYNRFLCAVDGYYPGGDGFVIRTAANAFGNGCNALILGGSTDKGSARAVENFLSTLTRISTSRSLLVPWLLQVELGGACRNRFAADRKEMEVGEGSPVGHQNNSVRRFYDNAQKYYWSGDSFYLQRTKKDLSEVLRTKIRGKNRIDDGHYAIEFFVRAYDMLDDSGVFTTAEIKELDRAIADNFQSWTETESGWRRPVYGKPEGFVVNDHHNASWLADKVMAQFLLRHLPDDQESLRKEASDRLALYRRAFDTLLQTTWRADTSGSAHNDVALMTLFRYGLEEERYQDLFDSGNASKAVQYLWARTNPKGTDIGLIAGLTEGQTQVALLAGICASYSRDGGFRALAEQIPPAASVHYGVLVNGVHMYRPGPGEPAADPQVYLGLQVVPLGPRQIRKKISPAAFSASADKSHFDYVTYRSDLSLSGENLLLSGGYDLPGNALVNYWQGGQLRLLHTADPLPYFQNAVTVQKSSDPFATVSPSLATLNFAEEHDDVVVYSADVAIDQSVTWRRNLILVKGKFFFVWDAIRSNEEGRYLMVSSWRAPGRSIPVPDGWCVRQNQGFLHLLPADAGQSRMEDEIAPRFQTRQPLFNRSLSAALRPGDDASLAALVFVASSKDSSDYAIRQSSPTSWIIQDCTIGQFYAIGFESSELTVTTPSQTLHFPAQSLSSNSSNGQAALEALWTRAGKALENTPPIRPPEKDAWTAVWHFDGFLKPSRVEPLSSSRDGVFEFPETVEVCEIVGKSTKAPTTVTAISSDKLPTEWNFSEHRFADWTMENYGRMVVRPDEFWRLTGTPVPARSVRLESIPPDPKGVLFFRNDRKSSPFPLQLALQHTPSGTALLVFPKIWHDSRSVSPLRADVGSLSLDGKVRWMESFSEPASFFRALQNSNGLTRLYAGLLSGQVEEYDTEGRRDRSLTIPFEESAESVAGDSFTFKDAFGHAAPSAIGRLPASADTRSPAGFAMARYWWASFFNEDGRVLGHNIIYGYWTNDILPYGLPQDRSGLPLTAMMTSETLLLVYPTDQPQAIKRDGMEEKDYLHRIDIVRLPVEGPLLSGSPTLFFESDTLPGHSPSILVARENFVGIYDIATHKWVFSWQPPIPLTAAAVVAASRRMIVATRDGIVREIDFSEDWHSQGHRETQLSSVVRSIRADQDGKSWWLATSGGLWSLLNGSVAAIASGSFTDILEVPGDLVTVVATTEDGRVTAYQRPGRLGSGQP